MSAALLALLLALAPDAGAPQRLRQLVAAGKSGPEVVPQLVQALRQCRRDERPRAGDDESLTAASMMVAILEERPAAPEVRTLVPELLRGLDCADAGVRRLCAKGLGRPAVLGPPERKALRRRLASDPLPERRALVAAILGAGGSDVESVKALERALSDKAESVRLASASALLQLGKPARARPALERLSKSRDPAVAAAAARLNAP